MLLVFYEDLEEKSLRARRGIKGSEDHIATLITDVPVC